MKRRGQGYPPKVTFTSDGHVLVNGDLIAEPCLLRYDPHRVVPRNEIPGLSRTQRPITAHVRLHPAGELWQQDLLFPQASRLIVDDDAAGQGTMLETKLPLPEGCDELECWFSYVDNHGQPHWDSNAGANFWIRFSIHDLNIAAAEIVPRPDAALDLFKLEVDTAPEVDSIDARWRYTNSINEARFDRLLTPTLLAGQKSWKFPDDGASVSSNTPLAFDLVYQVGGRSYTDDNQGTWYIVSR